MEMEHITLQGKELFQRQQPHVSTNTYVKMMSKSPTLAFYLRQDFVWKFGEKLGSKTNYILLSHRIIQKYH